MGFSKRVCVYLFYDPLVSRTIKYLHATKYTYVYIIYILYMYQYCDVF